MGRTKVKAGDTVIINNPTRDHAHFKDLMVEVDETDDWRGTVRIGKEIFHQDEVSGTGQR